VTAQAIVAEYINVRNIRIWVAHGGEGQPLLYLPGVAPEFDDPALSLISQDFHVYRPHHPGFGRSDEDPARPEAGRQAAPGALRRAARLGRA
jgi:hypothetical protein